MYEIHANEQYFFADETVKALSDLLTRYENPCALCAPSVGRVVAAQKHPVTVLDIDERFEEVAGFHHYNLARPEHLDGRFDLILCDPPFFNISLSQLFTALRLLSHFDLSQRLMVSYLTRRADAVESVFAPFNLRRTAHHPAYQTVRKCERNDIVFFTNFDLPEGWAC